MKRAFVTGGSGCLGGHLIPALRARGIEVAALARSDRAAAKVEALGATVVRGDLDDVKVLEAGMRGPVVEADGFTPAAGADVEVLCLPHPSGASTWHRLEPGRSLLEQALGMVARHPAMRDALAA